MSVVGKEETALGVRRSGRSRSRIHSTAVVGAGWLLPAQRQIEFMFLRSPHPGRGLVSKKRRHLLDMRHKTEVSRSVMDEADDIS